MKNTCLCDSGCNPEYCCLPLLHELKRANNPLQLMRARYYAHTSVALDFIIKNTLPSNQKDINLKVLKNG